MELLSEFLALLAGAPAIVVPAATALSIFLTSDWRVSLLALLLQYTLVGVGFTRYLPFEVALAKTVAGGLAVLILFLSARQFPPAQRQASDEEDSHFLGLRFGWLSGPLGLASRLLAALVVVLTLVRLYGGGGFIAGLVPAEVALLAAWMGVVGLMGLVLGGSSLRGAVALLTMLTGFDVVYAGLDAGLAIAGAFSAFTIMAALAFSYLSAAEARAARPRRPADWQQNQPAPRPPLLSAGETGAAGGPSGERES